MKKIGVLVLLLVGTIALAADYTKDDVDVIKAKVQKGEVVLIDVREKNEWDEGHVSGAKLLSLSKISKGATKAEIESVVGKDKVVYLHCKAGSRCMKAAEILEKQGFKVQAIDLPVGELINSLGKAK
ncbi:MAG: rhodanese-like domain-containing protein [Planctomycetota bacterium]